MVLLVVLPSTLVQVHRIHWLLDIHDSFTDLLGVSVHLRPPNFGPEPAFHLDYALMTLMG